MYHDIIKNQIDLIYNEIFLFKGAVEELGQEEIDENVGGFSSREIIVRLLYMPKDENEDIVKIENNNFITYDSKKYIIDTFSEEKGIYGVYYNLHAYEMIKEDNPVVKNAIRDKLLIFINDLLPISPKINLIDKFKLRTQEDYGDLPYPRYFYDFRKNSNIDIFKGMTEEGVEQTRYENIWLLEIETYGGLNDVFELSEIFQDEAEIALKGLEFMEYNEEFKEIVLNSFETIVNQNVFQDNQPRIRKLYSIEFLIAYIKETKNIERLEEVEVKGGVFNATNSR